MNKYNHQKLYENKPLKTIMLDNKIFKKLINSDLEEIDYIHLSFNKNLNKKQMEYLFKLKIDNVNINLLRNKNCPKIEIENFLSLNDKIYNIAIAHNTNLTQKHIDTLLKTEDKDINMSLQFSGLL